MTIEAEPHSCEASALTTAASLYPRGVGDSHMEQTGMVIENFEFNP